jgi:hypothetical protein
MALRAKRRISALRALRALRWTFFSMLLLPTVCGRAYARFGYQRPCYSAEIPPAASKNQPLVIESRVFHKFL